MTLFWCPHAVTSGDEHKSLREAEVGGHMERLELLDRKEI